jgi:UDP-N-acetylglucosamine 1-carboxyvinyltransferase
MDLLKITGGIPLKGHVKAPGAKNALTKLLVASLLSEKKSIFRNVPNIEDVTITVDLCREIGSEVAWDKEEGIIEIETKEIKASYIPQRFSGANRIPILMIGALLGRTRQDIIVPTAGGCNIGKRPVNFHMEALSQMGASVEHREMRKEGAYFAHAYNGLHGAVIDLPYPSVGATENTILAAVRAKGATIIRNAAVEPEIIDLILYLQKLGASITVDVNRSIHIQHAETFYEVDHTVMTDRVVAASLGMAAIGTKGRVFVEGAEHLNMITFLNKLREIGGGFSIQSGGIEFFYSSPLKGGIHLETDVHPGFLTDWQQPFVSLLTQAHGSSVIHETVYEKRFGYTETLKEMGADVELFTQCLGGKPCRFASHNFHHSAVVKGATPLEGRSIAIPDLRAGYAYVMAALIATGTSEISNVHFLDRGYENLTEKLAALGADITRVKQEENNPLKKLVAKATTL